MWITHIPIFSKKVSCDKFRQNMKYWHFSNNSILNWDTHPHPKLQKLYEVIENLCNNFSSTLIPEKYISADESLLLFKGRSSSKQYILLKKSCFGIQLFVLYESQPRYIYGIFYFRLVRAYNLWTCLESILWLLKLCYI